MEKKLLFKNCFRRLSVMLFTALSVSAAEAQHLDELRFGNPESEQIHGLTAYDLSKSETYTGQAGLKARRLLPDDKNPFAGNFPGTYGGEVVFVMKVDGNRQNYFTAKFSGNETYSGRILLIVNGKEVGGRHTDGEEYFDGFSGPVSPGAFYYRTAPLPRPLTDGQTEVVVRLRSTGNYYYYGKPHNYPTYQKVLAAPTRGVYAAFTHTDAGFSLDDAEVEGQTPSYAEAATKSSPGVKMLYEEQVRVLDEKILNLLKGPNTLSQNAAWNQLELLAKCYERPEIKSAYHQQAVIAKVCAIIDQFVITDNAGLSKAKGDWGGYYGRSGNAVALLGSAIPDTFLDEIINLGRSNVTRRSEWIRIFKESFEFGAANRRSISNQEMFASLSVFGAALALKRLDPVAYSGYADLAYHQVLESCGIEQFTGNAVIHNSTATLGNPANTPTGAGYYFTTLKGTTHEPGWVSPDCYGNLGNTLIEIYEMSKKYAGGDGDQRILGVAVRHSGTQATFTYPWTIDGKRAILAEGFDCVRNIYVPGKIFYGSPEVAGASGDPTLLGFMAQKINDGQLEISKGPRNMSSVYYLDLFNKLMTGTYTAKVASTPGQPDGFFADEENGIVTIRNGKERLFMNMYFRTSAGNNRLIHAHYINEKEQRFIEFRPQYTEYRTDGTLHKRSKSVLSWSGEAPDSPVSAYYGQQDTVSLGHRGILDLYQVHYNNYFIAMNTTRPGIDKIVKFPRDLVGKTAYCLNTGKTIVLPATMAISPLTTFIFKIAEQNLPGGIAKEKIVSCNKTNISDVVSRLETFAQDRNTIRRIALTPSVGNYPFELYNNFIFALSKAKYMANNQSVSQDQVDNALLRLNKAHAEFLNSGYQ